MNKKSKLETLRSVGANLQTTIHVINCFYIEKGWKAGENNRSSWNTYLAKNH